MLRICPILLYNLFCSLLGVKYDFFGIGEFWGCKSQHNDFGLQFRLFYYKQASLIGGVSLKAGRSIVTVMTVKAQDSHQNPIVRYYVAMIRIFLTEGLLVNGNFNRMLLMATYIISCPEMI